VEGDRRRIPVVPEGFIPDEKRKNRKRGRQGGGDVGIYPIAGENEKIIP